MNDYPDYDDDDDGYDDYYYDYEDALEIDPNIFVRWLNFWKFWFSVLKEKIRPTKPPEQGGLDDIPF